jgi:hypothetical protein
MWRELVGCFAKPPEIDDLTRTASCRTSRDRHRCGTIKRFKVAGAKRMNKVIDDIDTLECATHRITIRRISGDPLDTGVPDRTRVPRHTHDAVLR